MCIYTDFNKEAPHSHTGSWSKNERLFYAQTPPLQTVSVVVMIEFFVYTRRRQRCKQLQNITRANPSSGTFQEGFFTLWKLLYTKAGQKALWDTREEPERIILWNPCQLVAWMSLDPFHPKFGIIYWYPSERKNTPLLSKSFVRDLCVFPQSLFRSDVVFKVFSFKFRIFCLFVSESRGEILFINNNIKWFLPSWLISVCVFFFSMVHFC